MGVRMLKLALDKCRGIGFAHVDIVPHKGNAGAVLLIVKSGAPADVFAKTDGSRGAGV